MGTFRKIWLSNSGKLDYKCGTDDGKKWVDSADLGIYWQQYLFIQLVSEAEGKVWEKAGNINDPLTGRIILTSVKLRGIEFLEAYFKGR